MLGEALHAEDLGPYRRFRRALVGVEDLAQTFGRAGQQLLELALHHALQHEQDQADHRRCYRQCRHEPGCQRTVHGFGAAAQAEHAPAQALAFVHVVAQGRQFHRRRISGVAEGRSAPTTRDGRGVVHQELRAPGLRGLAQRVVRRCTCAAPVSRKHAAAASKTYPRDRVAPRLSDDMLRRNGIVRRGFAPALELAPRRHRCRPVRSSRMSSAGGSGERDGAVERSIR